MENNFKDNKTSPDTSFAKANTLFRLVCVIIAVLMLWTSLSGFSGFGAGTSMTKAAAKTYSGDYLYCCADDYVSLRAGTSSSSKELAKINRGERMTYLNSQSGKWYYVRYASKKGYVYSDYVTFDKDSITSTLYCTADDFVSLRVATSASSKELAKIDRGESMKYLSKRGKWYYVKYSSKYGYVYEDYVSFKKPQVISNILYCSADDYVSLRAKASSTSKELARIPRGEKMGYLKKKSGKWYYVQYGSKKGYVYSDYVSSKKPNSDTTSSILWCTADDYVSLRAKASSSSKELPRIPRGEKMGYLNKKSGKWYYVQYGSKKGYVYSDYVSSKKPSSSSSSSSSSRSVKAYDYLYCTASDYVSLRSGPGSNYKELAKIPSGNKMIYLYSKSGRWYYVQYGSKKGYVYDAYVTSP